MSSIISELDVTLIQIEVLCDSFDSVLLNEITSLYIDYDIEELDNASIHDTDLTEKVRLIREFLAKIEASVGVSCSKNSIGSYFRHNNSSIIKSIKQRLNELYLDLLESKANYIYDNVSGDRDIYELNMIAEKFEALGKITKANKIREKSQELCIAPPDLP